MSLSSNDPWAHRSAGMRCKTCMYFVEKAPTHSFGRCRRHAPTVLAGFPAVFDSDWCGDHKLDETKLGGRAVGYTTAGSKGIGVVAPRKARRPAKKPAA